MINKKDIPLKRFLTRNLGAVKKKKFYTCPFCEKEREIFDKTAINYRGKWYDGCQNCFMKSIDKEKSRSFQRKNY